MERYPPEAILWAGPTLATFTSRTLWRDFAEIGMRPTLAESGQALELGQGARLEVLFANPRGAVLLLKWGNFQTLLPLGVDFETLETLQRDPNLAHVTALLLAENGYAPVNPHEWIAALHPDVVLLSVAADDFDGLPSPETLEAVQGYPLLRTDLNGWIELTTDGETMWVETETR
jgi:hypothetical protein